jgi:predicted flap endonuclease-1-like 5' DNA nuclease
MGTTYEFSLVYALWALGGVILGLLLGRMFRRTVRVAAVADSAGLAAARTETAQAQRELAASREAMRPLADEVDRLKREVAKLRRTAQEPLPLATPLAPLPPLTAMTPMAPAVFEPLAGAGPIVAVVPGIRALKGVGDKFAAALEAIGLGSVDTIARLNADEALDADTRLGVFNGRIAKDRLVEQAVLLDEGRTTEYAARFGTPG